jgi:hypothetical protein
MPAAAIVGAAVVGAVASNSAANKQAKAANAAADKSVQQATLDREQQLQLYQQQRADQAPYREAGYGALSQIQRGFAQGGDFNRDFTMADYQTDPGYQFRMSEGENAINRAATAAGSRYSGATLKALSRFNSDLASQEYGNAYNRFQNNVSSRYNRLASLAGIGQAANNQTQQAGTSAYSNIANIGANATNSINNSMQNAAAARASGYVGAANIVGGGLQQLANNYQQQQYMGKLQNQNNFNNLNTYATNQTSNFDTYGPGYSP